MSLIVQKFGGTSVADVNKIKSAAEKAIKAQGQWTSRSDGGQRNG